MAFEQLIWLVVPPLILLATSLWLLWPLLRCWYLRRDLEKRIAALGERHLRDVMLEDGMGGHSYFEWLLLTGEGICLLNTNQRDGNIFAGERMENWAQVVGSRSRQFANPLFALEPLTATLRYHLPGTPLQGVVLFSGRCHFPKGRPQAVLTREELPAKFELRNIPLTLQRAWEQLQDKVRPLEPHTEGHLLPYREGPGAWRMWLAMGLFVLALLWVGWQLWPH